MDEVQGFINLDTFPVETGTNMEIIYSDSAKIQAVLKAPRYKRYEGNNPYTVLPAGMLVIFYDSVMREKTRLTASYAIKYDKMEVMEVRHNVEVVNAAGEKLNTEKLIWNEQARRIYTDVFVKITQPDKILYGEGMDADDSFSKWEIRKPRGTFYVNTDEEENEGGD
jgi:LPS export ABC transporter protein LptC